MLRTELNYILLVLLSLLLFEVLLITGQDKVWTRMDGSTVNDIAYGVAFDSAGSVYVTGYASGCFNTETFVGGNTDMILLKYFRNGTRVWTKMIGTAGDDSGQGVAVDPTTGNIYAIGYVSDTIHGQTFLGGLQDMVLVKYSANGTRIWTKLAGSSAADLGYGVAVDSTGAVYATGMSQGSVNGQAYVQGYDMFLIKFSSNGTAIYTRMAGTTGNDNGRSVALDMASGFLYITGYSEGSLNGQSWTGNWDIFLMKYSLNGTLVWTKLTGTVNLDAATAVSVNTSSGAVYITGYCTGNLHGQASAGQQEGFVIKYASNGTRVWTNLVGTTLDDAGFGVAADASTGSVYLTGRVGRTIHGETFLGGTYDIVLVKFASNGTRLWTKLAGSSGDDIGYGLAVSSSFSTVYLTGQGGSSVDSQPYAGGLDLVTLTYVTQVSQPTRLPTGQPSGQPTGQPSSQPTTQPSRQPTGQPTSQPSMQPSSQPVGVPTGQPSSQPTRQPTGQPSSQPSRQPTCQPSVQPSCQPSGQPTGLPSSQPSVQPSMQPSGQPSVRPSRQPSSQPSGQPTGQPTKQPSSEPTRQPTGQPSMQPKGEPSGQPSNQPTRQPTRQPSGQPSCQPNRSPTGTPTGQPIGTPTEAAVWQTHRASQWPAVWPAHH